MVDLNKQELQTIHDAAVVLTEDFHHAEQVCRLSLAIYDDLSSVHGYGKRTGRLLAAAALLHDIGWSISTVSHNKCGMTFIIEDRMLPLSLYERILVADSCGTCRPLSQRRDTQTSSQSLRQSLQT